MIVLPNIKGTNTSGRNIRDGGVGCNNNSGLGRLRPTPTPPPPTPSKK